MSYGDKFSTDLYKTSDFEDSKFPYYKCTKNIAGVVSASVIGGTCALTILGTVSFQMLVTFLGCFLNEISSYAIVFGEFIA